MFFHDYMWTKLHDLTKKENYLLKSVLILFLKNYLIVISEPKLALGNILYVFVTLHVLLQPFYLFGALCLIFILLFELRLLCGICRFLLL